MDGPENTQPPEEVAIEKTYPVKLRPPVFSFLAEKLGPIYKDELEKVQREDGSFKGLSEFRSSHLEEIMVEIKKNKSEYPDELPDNLILHLSKKRVAFLEDNIPWPEDAAGSALRREMMRDVKKAFSDARTSYYFEKVRSKFRRS